MPSSVTPIRNVLISIIIKEVKEYSATYKTTALKALDEGVLHKWFYYVNGQLSARNEPLTLSKRDFFDMICNFILSDKNIIPTKYLKLIHKYYNYVLEFLPLDEEYYKNLCDSLYSERVRIKNLESSMSETIRILNHQDAFTSADFVLPLVEALRLKEVSDFFIFIDLFNYGFIQGKRAERARHKNSQLLAAQAKERQGKRNDLNIPQNSAECSKNGETREDIAKIV